MTHTEERRLVMSATSRHPAHDLFDHWWVPGGIQTLVLQEHARNPSVDAEAEKLATFYRTHDCVDAARLIAYIASEPGLVQIGSGTVDVGAIIGLEPTQDPWALQELYIGRVNPKISPLQWFGYLSRSFEKIPEQLRFVFNAFCKSILSMVQAPSRRVSADELDERPRLPIPRH